MSKGIVLLFFCVLVVFGMELRKDPLLPKNYYNEDELIIDCVSDLHGHYPKLDGGDLLIVAGDLTSSDELQSINYFKDWIGKYLSKYKKVIIVAGNRDNWLQQNLFVNPDAFLDCKINYLYDSGTEFEGLKIWGSPWTKTFEGMNPKCKAFTVDTEEELEEKWARIPANIDILITHAASYGIRDEVDIVTKWGTKQFNVGSLSLLKFVQEIQPKLHVFGHIHEGYGQEKLNDIVACVNASHVNELYEPVNKPIRIIL